MRPSTLGAGGGQQERAKETAASFGGNRRQEMLGAAKSREADRFVDMQKCKAQCGISRAGRVGKRIGIGSCRPQFPAIPKVGDRSGWACLVLGSELLLNLLALSLLSRKPFRARALDLKEGDRGHQPRWGGRTLGPWIRIQCIPIQSGGSSAPAGIPNHKTNSRCQPSAPLAEALPPAAACSPASSKLRLAWPLNVSGLLYFDPESHIPEATPL